MPWKEIRKEDLVFSPEMQTYCDQPEFKCPNYGHKWTCPPEAPYLEKEIMKYNHFYLIYIKKDLPSKLNPKKSGFSTLSDEEKLNHLRSHEFMRDQVEAEIKNFIENNLLPTRDKITLWDGNCRICEKKGEKCTFDNGVPCPYPDEKTYSMQAIGMDVTKTVQNADLDIQWPPKDHVFRFALVCTT